MNVESSELSSFMTGNTYYNSQLIQFVAGLVSNNTIITSRTIFYSRYLDMIFDYYLDKNVFECCLFNEGYYLKGFLTFFIQTIAVYFLITNAIFIEFDFSDYSLLLLSISTLIYYLNLIDIVFLTKYKIEYKLFYFRSIWSFIDFVSNYVYLIVITFLTPLLILSSSNIISGILNFAALSFIMDLDVYIINEYDLKMSYMYFKEISVVVCSKYSLNLKNHMLFIYSKNSVSVFQVFRGITKMTIKPFYQIPIIIFQMLYYFFRYLSFMVLKLEIETDTVEAVTIVQKENDKFLNMMGIKK